MAYHVVRQQSAAHAVIPPCEHPAVPGRAMPSTPHHDACYVQGKAYTEHQADMGTGSGTPDPASGRVPRLSELSEEGRPLRDMFDSKKKLRIAPRLVNESLCGTSESSQPLGHGQRFLYMHTIKKGRSLEPEPVVSGPCQGPHRTG